MSSPAYAKAPRAAAVFPARFVGECARCGYDIRVGEYTTKRAGRYEHSECESYSGQPVPENAGGRQ